MLLLISLLLLTTYVKSQEKFNFSHASMVCDSSFFLEMNGDYKSIRFTKDGSIPNSSSKRFRSPLKIDKTVFLLFKITDNNGKDTIVARTFIFDTTTHLPILSIAINHNDLWDEEKGIYCRGKNAFFSDSSGHWENCNFQKKWEKPVFAIYLDSTEVINQACGLRIFGESTRRQPDKSMKIVARKKYGNNRFHYPFFSQKPHIKEYKQLVIRTSGNDYNKTRFKDVLNAYLIRNTGIDYMAFQPIRLYVSGVYWGVYNLREKINKYYLFYNHGAHPDSSSIIMGRWVTQHGSRKDYMKMYNWFLKLDTMNEDAYAKAQTFLDIKNYATYKAFQIYTNNVDSRGNIRYWNSKDKDGKFRMILYDTDLGFSRVSRDYLKKCLSPVKTDWFNNTWSTLYFRKLIQNDKFRYEFVNQYAHLLNTALHSDTVLSAIEYLKSVYIDELPRDKKEIAPHLKYAVIPMERWLKNITQLRFFALKRPEIARKEITDTLAPKGTFMLHISANNASVSINNNYYINLPFDGVYFKDIPLPVSIKADSNYWLEKHINGHDTLLAVWDTVITAHSDSVYLLIKTKEKETPVSTVSSLPKKQTIAQEPASDYRSKLQILAWVFIGIGCCFIGVYFWFSRKK